MMSISQSLSANRVVIAHSDPVIRLGLSTTLAHSRFADSVVSCLPDDKEFDSLVDGASLVVTDYNQGVAVASRLRRDRQARAGAPANVMVVSGRDGEHEIRSAVDAGVKGYLLSGFELSEFVEGVDIVCRGTRYLCSAAANKMVDSMCHEALTAREMQVLQCLVDGYVNKLICMELDIALGTVKAHVKAIFSKLGVVTRTQAVTEATKRGITAPSSSRSTVSATLSRSSHRPAMAS